MEIRNFCYEFIETNECSLKEKCPNAHVIIPDEEKESFLKMNPKENNEFALSEGNFKITPMNGGKAYLSTCQDCGKGNHFKKEDLVNKTIRMYFCKSCVTKR